MQQLKIKIEQQQPQQHISRVSYISIYSLRLCESNFHMAQTDLFVCLFYLHYGVCTCTHSWLFELYILRQVALKRQQAVEDAIAMRLVSNETGKAIDALPPGKIFGMSITEPSATPSESNTNDNLLLVQKTKSRKCFVQNSYRFADIFLAQSSFIVLLAPFAGFFSSFW